MTHTSNTLNSELQNTLKDLVVEARTKAGLVAVGAGVMKSGELIALAADGQRQRNDPGQVTIDDLWHIGSITKSITATAIARMVEQGACSFRTTLGEVFAGGSLSVHDVWSDVTLEQLLAHRAGASASISHNAMRESHRLKSLKARQSHRTYFVEKELSENSKSGEGKFLYSNTGYIIAGVAAERLSGRTWEQLVEDEVLKPLQLVSAGFGPVTGENPWGHQVGLFGKRAIDPEAEYADNPVLLGPAGTIHMSLQDLLGYGWEHVKASRGESSFLEQDTARKLHAPAPGGGDEYGCGWVISTFNGEPVIWHNGSNTLWYTILWLLPESDLAIAFTTNDGSVGKADRQFDKASRKLLHVLKSGFY